MEMLSNGILDIEDTEGEEISLTAEAPQLTEEEKLRIESEDEEDGEKRIDLFASEDGEADPLNKLLMAEDGISTLFMKKGGRVPLKDGTDEPAIQGGGPNYLGKQPEVKVPKYWKSSPDHPDTELAYITEPEKQVLIALNMHGGLEDGKPNTGPNGIISLQGDLGSIGGSSGNEGNGNEGSDKGHSRFDVGSGYYGETVTTNNDDDGGTVETIGGYNIDDDDDTTDAEDLFETYTNVKDRYDRNKTKQNYNMVKNVLTGNIVGVLTGAYTMSKNKKEYENYVKGFKETALELGIPEYSPHTDTIVQTLEQELIDINKTRDKDEDEKDDDRPPVIEEIAAATQTLEDRDETDIFDLWDRIKSNQAKRAMLVEKDIIQDNKPEETMMLNSGGLANLFRVKTQ